MEAEDYAKKAYQWAKALRLLDPSIKLISCGGTSTIKSSIRAAADGHCQKPDMQTGIELFYASLRLQLIFIQCIVRYSYSESVVDQFGTQGVSSVVYTVSEGKHIVNVMGRVYNSIFLFEMNCCLLCTTTAAAAEKALEITHSLIDFAKIESGLNKDLTVYVQPFVTSFRLAHTSVGALMNGMSGRSCDISRAVHC